MRRRTPPQKRFHNLVKRFNIAVWGRQSGKTTTGLDKMIYKPLQGREYGVYWYILQTYAAADVAFKRYCHLLKESPVLEGFNKSDLFATLSGGRTVHFKSGKNWQDLRVETLDGCIIDEYRQQNPDLWPQVVRPMLSKRKGWCDFLSTTNGYDHFKDLYDQGLENPAEWGTIQAPSTEAWWWDEAEIASARSTMTEDVFAQEILAEFREIGVGKVYKSHGLWNQKEENPLAIRGMQWNQYLPIIVGMDFNVGHMRWILGQKQGTRIHYADEIAIDNTDTEQCAKVLAQKVEGHKPGVVIIGDASGNARKTSAVGETDYKLIKKVLTDAKIKYEDKTPDSNPPIKDRVNAMNSALKAADGTVNLTYNPRTCKAFKKDLERHKWKAGAMGTIFDTSDSSMGHSSDAAGYPVVALSGLFKTSPGGIVVINR